MEGDHLMAEQAFPNPLGVHALVWVGDTSPASVDYAVTKTKETGYDLLELSLHDMTNLDVAAARRRLIEAGLRVVCSRGLVFDADISSEDPTIVERGEQLLHDSLQITAELGGTHLTGVLYSALGKYPHPLSDAGRRNVVAVLGRLAQQARGRGVTLGLEICNRYETNVVNTARQALALADDIGEDNVLLHLDTYHMNIEEDDLVRPVREVGDRLGYVHIGENHRGYLGSGHLDFTAFFHALTDIDYTGPITFESFSSAVIAGELSNHLAIWRNLWNDSEDLARHARIFIADHLITTNTS
jgi:D-psicose/D-tagatose/L-ribulose 3-epimerase